MGPTRLAWVGSRDGAGQQAKGCSHGGNKSAFGRIMIPMKILIFIREKRAKSIFSRKSQGRVESFF